MSEKLMNLGSAVGDKSDVLDVKTPQGKKYRIMIDCGAGADLSLLEDGVPIDAVIISHIHVDHTNGSGWLFRKDYLLRKEGLSGPLREDAMVFCAPQTAEFLAYTLLDQLRGPCAFTIYEAIGILDRIRVVEKPGELEILPGLTVFFVPMGHTPGNMGVVIPTLSGRLLFFTSDMALHDMPLTKGALPWSEWPEKWLPTDFGSTEWTYPPNQEQKSFGGELDRLVETVQGLLKEGRTIVIGAAANDRTHNVSLALSRAGIHPWIDGASRDRHLILTKVTWSDRDTRMPEPGVSSGIYFVEDEEHREELLDSDEPGVFITTGMFFEHGPINRYIEKKMDDPNTVIIVISWQPPGSKGEKLRDIAEGRLPKEGQVFPLEKRIGWNEVVQIDVPIRAQVLSFAIRGHNYPEETVAWVKELYGIRKGKLFSETGKNAADLTDEEIERVKEEAKFGLMIQNHGEEENKAWGADQLRPCVKSIISGAKGTTVTL